MLMYCKSTPLRANPSIAAESINIPQDIMRYWGTVCRSIKKSAACRVQAADYIEIVKLDYYVNSIILLKRLFRFHLSPLQINFHHEVLQFDRL